MANIGEKFGSSQKTEASEDFKGLEVETAQRKECIDGLLNPLEAYYQQLTKTKGKKPILQNLAEGFANYGNLLCNDSTYGICIY